MNKNTIVTVMLVLMMLAAGSVFAGNEDRIGTAGALELLIPVDARGAALGGAATANSFGISAIYWNPAGMAEMEGTQAMFTHIPWIADIDIEYAAIATTIEDFGMVAVSLKIVDYGEMIETTDDGDPDGTGRVFSPSSAVIGLTFAKPLTTTINFGFSGFVVKEDYFEVSSTGMAFDFGFTYTAAESGLSLGITMKNFGSDMSFSGRGLERVYEEAGRRPVGSNNAAFGLPTSVNIGIAYDVYKEDKHLVTTMGNFRGNNQSTDYWQGGAEYVYDEWLALRGGYKYSEQEGYIYGASFGGGITRQIGDLDVTFGYTWWETDVFDANQFFTFMLAF